MSLNLPPPSTDRLWRSPLELVVCQVRHEKNVAVADTHKALAVHRALSDQYPELEDINESQVEFAVGKDVGPLTRTSEATGWRFKSEGNDWIVSLLPTSFALETTAYGDWALFRARLTDLLKAVDDSLSPALERRIGMRMINRIKEPQIAAPQDWKGWIHDDLLGPALHPELGGAIRSTQQIVEIEADESMRAILRHGFSRDQGQDWSYVLDTDCFRRVAREFMVDAILDSVEQLHTLALQIFQASITTGMHSFLKEQS